MGQMFALLVLWLRFVCSDVSDVSSQNNVGNLLTGSCQGKQVYSVILVKQDVAGMVCGAVVFTGCQYGELGSPVSDCLRLDVRACMRTCMHVCVYVCVHVCVCVFAWRACVHV